MSKKGKFQTPVQIMCQLCGSLAESWHGLLPMPPGKTAGRGTCECGALSVDSLGIFDRPDLARVIARDPRAIRSQNDN